MSEPGPTPADRPPEITCGAVVRAAWQQLKQMRTVFLLLGLLAVAALLCTLIPQGLDRSAYQERYPAPLAALLTAVGLDHVHSTLWFQGLIGLLLLSLIACSGRLWQEARQRWRLPAAEAATRRVATAQTRLLALRSFSQVLYAIREVARRRGYQVVPLRREATLALLYLHKHRLSAWGQALAHYSVFLVALGSVLGSLHGLSLDRTVPLLEGQTLSPQDSHLPFALALDRFTIDRDRAQDTVRNYYSQVRLLEDGREVRRETIAVNHPLRHRGYFITQSGWGLAEARVLVRSKGQAHRVTFPLGREQTAEGVIWAVPPRLEEAVRPLPGGDTALVATAFSPDAIRKDGTVLEVDSEYPGTAALALSYVYDLHRHRAAAPQTVPPRLEELGFLLAGETRRVGEATVTFEGLTLYSTFGLRRDLGLPLVWAGFLMAMLGLSLIFYLPLQRCVLSVQALSGGGVTVTLAAYGQAGDLDGADKIFAQDLLTALDATTVVEDTRSD